MALAGPGFDLAQFAGTSVMTVPRVADVVKPIPSEMGVAELPGIGGRAEGLETNAQIQARLNVAGSPAGAAEA